LALSNGNLLMPTLGSDLIEQYRQIHASSVYGAPAHRLLRFVRPQVLLLRPKSILDYGCGQSELLTALALGYPAELFWYDPAIPSIASPPATQVDLVLNTDVLEHIPEADLGNVVSHMASLGRDALIFVDTRPARTILPNGENAHCTVRSAEWWADFLRQFFPTLEPIRLLSRRRAVFRTWSLGPLDTIRFPFLRAAEEVKYIAYKRRRRSAHING